MKRSKRYAEIAKSYDKHELVDVATAVKQIKSFNNAKFDETVEMHFRLGVDGRHADQQVRGAMVLPHGTGKSKKVLVFAKGPKAEEATAAGADFVGAEDMADKIRTENWFGFDAVVATPDMMGKLGRLGRILGPRGLMPNPKTGTVTMNVTQAVEEIKKGKVEYRVDKEGNVNCMIGKTSFSEEALAQNYKALYDQLMRVKPNTIKGAYIKKITVSTTMGPGIRVAAE